MLNDLQQDGFYSSIHKRFLFNICMAASLHLARLRQECSGARWMILPTYGVIATMTSDHDGEATHEGLGIGRRDADDCRSGGRL